MLVALPESPEAYKKGLYKILPAAEAKISAFDRSFHFGDSIYEVSRTYNGVIFSLDEHMVRMKASLDLAAFEEYPDFEILKKMILESCKEWFRKNGNKEVYVRWMVSRGLSDLNISRAVSTPPYGFVFVKGLEAPSSADFEKGYHYAIVSRLRNHPRAVDPHMKSGNYINNILALSEAQKIGAQDAIMCDMNGHITEGTTNNVYTIKDGKVYTSPSSIGILDGITRRWIFEICKNHGISMEEKLMTPSEFASSDEIFMSSSVKEIMPITTLNGKKIGDGKPGNLTRKLAGFLKTLINDRIQENSNDSLYS